jgi:ADP-heptose:LPS heptosyltransferase
VQELRPGEIRRILVLNRNHIGDCLLTTPMLRSLKRGFPRAHLAVSVPAANRELLERNPHIDEIVIRPEIKSWAAKVRFGFQMRRGGHDLIVSLQEKSTFYAWATYQTGLLTRHPPLTLALEHRRTRRYYQHVSPVRPDRHEVYKYLGIASLLGCPEDTSPVLELEPPAESRERVAWFLQTHGVDPAAGFIGINPGGTSPAKRWEVDRFAAAADRLRAETGLPVVVFGGAVDRDRAAEIAARMAEPPLVSAGRASLGDTAALLERCQLLVTGDTGPMHMAVALAVPVVALFGPTDPVRFGPFTSLSCVLRHPEPCDDCRARRRKARSGARKRMVRDQGRLPTEDAPCLHTITVEECCEAALRLYHAPPVPVRVERP